MIRWLGIFLRVAWRKIAYALAFAAVAWGAMDYVRPPVAPDQDQRHRPATCPPRARPAHRLPATTIMQAVAANDRQLAGARCPGDLVGPAVRMLA